MTEASRIFLDSNIWIYALFDDDDEKAIKAREIVKQAKGQIYFSSQVANKSCLNLKRKSLISEKGIRRLLISFFLNCTYIEMTEAALISASELRESHSISYWDSLIAIAAYLPKAEILFSEDMQDGFRIANQLTIVNPFK